MPRSRLDSPVAAITDAVRPLAERAARQLADDAMGLAAEITGEAQFQVNDRRLTETATRREAEKSGVPPLTVSEAAVRLALLHEARRLIEAELTEIGIGEMNRYLAAQGRAGLSERRAVEQIGALLGLSRAGATNSWGARWGRAGAGGPGD